MKHTRFYFVVAAVLLSLSAFVSNSRPRKTTYVVTAFYKVGGVWTTLFYGAVWSELNTTFKAGLTAKIVTTFGTHTLYATPNTLHPLYVN